MSELRDTWDKTVAEAERRNCEIKLPEPNELFIDIDRKEDFEAFYDQLTVLRERFECEMEQTQSPSGEPWHFHIRVKLFENGRPYELEETMRIALQASLGSDRKRELLSLRRIIDHADRPVSLFFEKRLF